MTDLFVHSDLLKDFTPHTWYDCEFGVGGKELIHDNCNKDVLNLEDSEHETPTMFDYLQAIYNHLKVCNK